MDRLAVLVDAGYLLSQSVQILSDRKSKVRKDIAISDPHGLIGKLIEHATEALSNRRLLRVYWYDGVSAKLSDEQEALSQLPDVQFRAGTIRSGQQKGVDSKIMADLIELSSNHAISDAVLVTGDGDLAVGIDLAQRRGVRIAILGIEDTQSGVPHNQSFEVIGAADRVKRIGRPDIAPYLSYVSAVPSPTPSKVTGGSAVQPPTAKKLVAKKATTQKAPPVPAKAIAPTGAPVAAAKTKASTEELLVIVKQLLAEANPPLEQSVVTASGTLDHSVDTKLLKSATEALKRTVMPSERTELRKLFREHLQSAITGRLARLDGGG